MSLKSILSWFLLNNAKSTIEFYLIDAFEIYHYLPIYNELVSRGIVARMIAEPCNRNTVKTWFDYDTAIHILKEFKIDYRIKADSNCPLAITTQTAKTLIGYKNLKVNITYGVSLKQNNFSISEDSSLGFSARLVHGDYQKQSITKFMRSKDIFIMGYPKHDKFFKNPQNKADVIKSLGITTAKPILLYAPTWDDDSSIMMFADEIGKLKDKFFIATKPHHCTFRLNHKHDELKKLYQISDFVFDGNMALEPLAIFADIVIVDAKSGAATELRFLNHDLPLVMLSPKQNIDAYFLPEIHQVGPVVNSLKNFNEVMETELRPYPINMENFYGKTDGLNSSRAADFLIGMLGK